MYTLSDLPKVAGVIRENKGIGKMTWFGTGGLADFFYIPRDAKDLQQFLIEKPKDLPIFIFGVGSNILFRDGGFRGVVIRLGAGFNYIDLTDDLKITAGAAVLDSNLANFCAGESITGLEFMSGIPGTIGGAVCMNAGAYGREVKDTLITAQVMFLDGTIRNISNAEFGFKYRSNSLAAPFIIIEATFQGFKGDSNQIKERFIEIQEQRHRSQPIKAKTGGSTFVNPEGQKAWQLIDQAGCRGLKIGGAKISELHCNFLINEDNATASDLERLIKEVQRRVLETSGIMLKTEIKIIGEEYA